MKMRLIRASVREERGGGFGPLVAMSGCLLLGSNGALRSETDAWRPQIRPAAQELTDTAPAPRPVSPTVINDSKPKTAQTEPQPMAVKEPGGQARQTGATKINVDAPAISTSAAQPPSAEESTTGESLVEQYCRVAVDAAVAAKIKEEEMRARSLKAEIERKVDELGKATADLQTWLKRREDFKASATENLVSVYAQMDPEAAAQRLTVVGEPTAAAILMKLPAKNASAVLGEMQPDMAGKMTAYMAGAAAVKAKTDEPAGTTQ
jgi:flagellar motility protein MotE (MotC chaperone)